MDKISVDELIPMKQLPRVVIIGAGFGGLQAAKALANAPVQVMLIDKQNYHLFQPLLYQVATSLLAPTEIAYPVRSIFRHQKNLEFLLAEVVGIDLERGDHLCQHPDLVCRCAGLLSAR
jgi:NADH dehydrogenase